MDQGVEYDSVADLCVAVLDDEYGDSFADDMMEVPPPGSAGRSAGRAGPAVSVVQADDPWVCLQRQRDHRAIV